jgi:hypothetical protein
VWDLGCNTREYSELALSSGAAHVIGFEADHGALDQAFARAADKDVLVWLVSLAPAGLVEFVPKDDPTVRLMLSSREDIFRDPWAIHGRGLAVR